LLAVATLMVLWAAFASATTPEAREKLRVKSVWVGTIGLVLAAVVYFVWPAHVEVDPARVAFLSDSFADVLQPAGFALGLILLIFAAEQLHPRYSIEQVASLLILVAGTNLVAMANDLVALFVALELVSIPTYV